MSHGSDDLTYVRGVVQRVVRSVVTGGVLLGVACTQAQNTCSNQQTPAAIDRKVDELIAKMTVDERIGQLQDRAPAIPRLNLPAYNWWNEGLHGLARDGYATVFPQAIGLAATWDAALMHGVGDVVSTEARAKFNEHFGSDSPRYGGLTIWSPNINIFRDPRWGRGQETYGEDPFLTGTLAAQFVKGVQGDDSFYRKADATPKHFAAHSGPEHGRDSFNAVVSQHDLQDTYFRAFHRTITEANAAAMMCSYNEINGIPSCATATNLQGMVRDQWGFRGYVVADCDAVGNIHQFHHYAPDAAHASALALKAGVDLDCGRTYDALNQAVAHALVTEADVNRSLHRLLVARIHLGMLDAASCTPYGSIGASQLDSPAHRALALKAAEESIVLLKNDGVLPLKAGRRVAVIGANADSLKILEANYHGTASHPVTPLQGMLDTMNVVGYAQGSALAVGLPAVIPRTALRTGAAPNAAAGLSAEYFDTAAPNGDAVARAQVNTLEYDIDRVPFNTAQKSKQYSARWTGYLVPPAAGEYTLRVDVERCWDCTKHDGFRLQVDGKQVLENDGGKDDRVTLHFADTKPHAIQLDYMHTGDDEGVALEWIAPAQALLEEAVQTATKADAIVLFAGLSPDLEGEALQVELPGFDGGDRTSLELPESQRALIARLRALGKPMVVVLTSGSAVALDANAAAANAVLEAWYPGEAGGEAIARTLTGAANPSGRLPVTFYRSVADLPAFTDYSMKHRTYRYFDGPVQYPFGFGLSFTRFSYTKAKLSDTRLPVDGPVTATVLLRNDGAVAGGEVAQLYVQPPQGGGAARIALAGVQRVTLRPGESRQLRFEINPEQLMTVAEDGSRSLRAGTYRVYIGGAQPDLGSSKALTFQIQP